MSNNLSSDIEQTSNDVHSEIAQLQNALEAIEQRQRNEISNKQQATVQPEPSQSVTDKEQSQSDVNAHSTLSPECELLLALEEELNQYQQQGRIDEHTLAMLKSKLNEFTNQLSAVPVAVGLGIFAAGLLVGRSLK